MVYKVEKSWQYSTNIKYYSVAISYYDKYTNVYAFGPMNGITVAQNVELLNDSNRNNLWNADTDSTVGGNNPLAQATTADINAGKNIDFGMMVTLDVFFSDGTRGAVQGTTASSGQIPFDTLVQSNISDYILEVGQNNALDSASGETPKEDLRALDGTSTSINSRFGSYSDNKLNMRNVADKVSIGCIGGTLKASHFKPNLELTTGKIKTTKGTKTGGVGSNFGYYIDENNSPFLELQDKFKFFRFKYDFKQRSGTDAATGKEEIQLNGNPSINPEKINANVAPNFSNWGVNFEVINV